jgi:hypothetical protein
VAPEGRRERGKGLGELMEKAAEDERVFIPGWVELAD